MGIDLKSSAPVELSFFDEKETLKHVNFKRKIQLFENFDFQLIMLLSDAQNAFLEGKTNFLNVENDKNWKFLENGLHSGVKSSAAIKIIIGTVIGRH